MVCNLTTFIFALAFASMCGVSLAQEAGLVQSSAAYMFGGVAAGALGNVGATFSGWAMSALGITSSNPLNEIANDLKSIENELNQIESTLNQMELELEAIDQQLVQNDCNTLNADDNPAVVLIKDLYTDYMSFMDTAKAGILPPVDCIPGATSPSDCIVEWAGAVLDDTSETSGVKGAVNDIAQSLVDNSQAQGVITACINPVILPIPVAGDFEKPYYDKALGLVNYYQYYQVLGMMMIAEAEHFHAWMYAGEPGGSPSDTSQYSYICEKTAGMTNCNNVVLYQNQLYDSLVQQFETSGVPYTDNNLVLHYLNGNNGLTGNLYPNSLENFTFAANSGIWPSDCPPGNLNSGSPCGILTQGIGTWEYESNGNGGQYSGVYTNVLFGNYTGWSTGFASDATSLLQGLGSGETVAVFLQNNGFLNMENKIIQTRTFVEVAVPGAVWGPQHDLCGADIQNNNMICFFDTNEQNGILCNNGIAANWLMANSGQQLVCLETCGGKMSATEYETNPQLASKYNGWYDGNHHSMYCLSSGCSTPQEHGYPGNIGMVTGLSFNWMLENNAYGFVNGQSAPGKKQFTLPSIDIQNLQCNQDSQGVTRSKKNSAGAFTRCGEDMDHWLAVNVPKPPYYSSSRVLLQQKNRLAEAGLRGFKNHH